MSSTPTCTSFAALTLNNKWDAAYAIFYSDEFAANVHETTVCLTLNPVGKSNGDKWSVPPKIRLHLAAASLTQVERDEGAADWLRFCALT